jgi:ABC-type multidrug transport system ATPase subunit
VTRPLAAANATQDLKVTAPAIKISGLSKTYRAGLVAVDELSMSLSRGAVLRLLGPNGAGKKTTIKMLAGLLVTAAGNLVAGILAFRLGEHTAKRRSTLARY